VRDELASYGGGLAEKPELIGLNKTDAMTAREASARRAALAKASGRPVLLLSGVTGQGVSEVLRALQAAVAERRKKGKAEDPGEFAIASQQAGRERRLGGVLVR
jgi:GTP-binding protein